MFKLKIISVILVMMTLISSCGLFSPKHEPSEAPGAIVYTVLPVKAGGTGTSAFTVGAVPYYTATGSRLSEISGAATGYYIEWNGTGPVYASVGLTGGLASSAGYTGSTSIVNVGALVQGSIGNGFSSIAFAHLQVTSGEAFFPVGSTTFTVTHGLGTTVRNVFFTWQSNPSLPVTLPWASNKGATTFNGNIPVTITGAPPTVAWIAIP